MRWVLGAKYFKHAAKRSSIEAICCNREPKSLKLGAFWTVIACTPGGGRVTKERSNLVKVKC
ncbi:hypothetical protein [Algoriphagus pacificus]|uniref:Uncharacterized protein n=1 Tax=Algoriphagus pacificus TaxID=2811234 RepID=A0ABS3CLC3_9BACT|nr:hypothetical protein [Algoriphagus pacificus]MBN7817349.1 hypothetical protein [Algoriphagus pacificus]